MNYLALIVILSGCLHPSLPPQELETGLVCVPFYHISKSRNKNCSAYVCRATDAMLDNHLVWVPQRDRVWLCDRNEGKTCAKEMVWAQKICN